MRKVGEILKTSRESKHINQEEIAKHLFIKKEQVEAIESGNWAKLPESAYVKGFIKNYAHLLHLDAEKLLALYRAEYDERKFVKPKLKNKRRLMFTPNLIGPFAFVLAVLVFLGYLLIQYTSVASAPKVEIYSPQNDTTTSASVIQISGKTDTQTTVSIDGQLVPIDDLGNFSYQLPLSDGQNTIEIVASKKLSPKTKITRIVRLAR